MIRSIYFPLPSLPLRLGPAERRRLTFLTSVSPHLNCMPWPKLPCRSVARMAARSPARTSQSARSSQTTSRSARARASLWYCPSAVPLARSRSAATRRRRSLRTMCGTCFSAGAAAGGLSETQFLTGACVHANQAAGEGLTLAALASTSTSRPGAPHTGLRSATSYAPTSTVRVKSTSRRGSRARRLAHDSIGFTLPARRSVPSPTR
jgi:hypothetical protein